MTRPSLFGVSPSLNKVRDDILPVILGGDSGVYPIGREFHEAYGIRSVCVVAEPVAYIKYSRIFEHLPVEQLDAPCIRCAVCALAEQFPDKKLLLIANTDALVKRISEISSQVPENVICCIPPVDVMERLSDKVEFLKLCREHGIDVPATELVDLSVSGRVPPTNLPFPLVAKPAVSAVYSPYLLRGCKKVYYVSNQNELDGIWERLRSVGFKGTFLVQELIKGDDTYMGSITEYVCSTGKTTLFGSARVLLEDHAPTMLGNPVAMITQQVPELWERTSALLEQVRWRGFANFDVKLDPTRGVQMLFEVNPRIGRNSFYNLAGGVNPMQVLVEDLVDGRLTAPRVVGDQILYTMVPVWLLRRYVRDPELVALMKRLVKEGKVYDPECYPLDASPRRMFFVKATELNQVYKFHRYYPRPTSTSF